MGQAPSPVHIFCTAGATAILASHAPCARMVIKPEAVTVKAAWMRLLVNARCLQETAL